PLRFRVDVADRKREGRVGDEAVERDAEVDRDEVALAGAVLGRDPMHDHRVGRDAEGGRIPLVALRGRHAALRVDVLLGESVELEHRDARLEVLADERDRLRDEGARLGHLLDLLRRLADDHVVRTDACSRASWISAKTSSTELSAWMPTTFPVAR